MRGGTEAGTVKAKAGTAARNPAAVQAERMVDRSEKESQRDRAVRAVLSGRTTCAMLGLPEGSHSEAIRHAVRLAMRILHPDAGVNIRLKGTDEYARIEAAFKKVNNIKDERIEAWFAGEPAGG